VVAGFQFAAVVMNVDKQVDVDGVASNTQAQVAFQEVYDLLGAAAVGQVGSRSRRP
jgi:hypothetical protein